MEIAGNMADGIQTLMRAQIAAEMEITGANYELRIALLRQTLQGLSTNATHCGMCQMHNEIYARALARDDALKG